MIRLSRFLIAAVLCVLSSTSAYGVGSTTAPDNSKKNEERAKAQLHTADDTSQAEADVKLSATIRKDLVKRNELSTYAKNIKIIIRDGNIRLAGPVKSAAEKETILNVAKADAPQLSVIDEITVTEQK